MKRCVACNKEMGFFETKIKRYTNEWEKVVLCTHCFESWNEAEKQRLIAKLFESSEPRLLFAIPDAKFIPRALDGYEDITIQHVGHLLFMDKGFCFLGVATKRSDDAEFGDHPGWSTFKFLYLGGGNKPPQGTGSGITDDQSLRAALEKANRLFFMRKEEIKKIKKPGVLFQHVFIETSDKKGNWLIEGISKAKCAPHDGQIDEYLKS